MRQSSEPYIHGTDSGSGLVGDTGAYRYKQTEDGKRQIFSFHIPGDMPDLQSLHLDVMDHSLSSLSACKVMFVPHETVRDLVRRCPRIGDAFWRETLIDGAVFREWILNVGRREAYERMAHLLCELYVATGANSRAERFARVSGFVLHAQDVTAAG